MSKEELKELCDELGLKIHKGNYLRRKDVFKLLDVNPLPITIGKVQPDAQNTFKAQK